MSKIIKIPDFDTLWKIGAVVGALVLGYIEFTKELDLLRLEMDGANTKIAELVEKHIYMRQTKIFLIEHRFDFTRLSLLVLDINLIS